MTYVIEMWLPTYVQQSQQRVSLTLLTPLKAIVLG